MLKEKVLWGMRKSVNLFNYDYFIKIDHDTLIDLPNLLKGTRKLPKENVYTGSCKSELKKGPYKRTFIYCHGGAYILSRDVVEKIASLSEKDTEIKLGYEEPEDAYVGWLVTQISKKFNNTDLEALPNWRIVDDMPKLIDHYRFGKWFYHWLKGLHSMQNAFECRIRANFTLCPSESYMYDNINSTACICFTKI
jgi:hypothetical protein